MLRKPRASAVPIRTRVSTAFTFVVIFFFIIVVAECSNHSEVKCSRTCVAQNCNSVGIRYGKFCGVGWTGCPGEKPCDDLDACCKIHDECVEKKGLINVKCHEKFKSCIKKVQKSGKVGFSRDCPYSTAVPTMVQGMDMAILLSQLGSSKECMWGVSGMQLTERSWKFETTKERDVNPFPPCEKKMGI